MTKVTDITPIENRTPKQVTEEVLNRDVKQILVIAETDDGQIFMDSNGISVVNATYLLEFAKPA